MREGHRHVLHPAAPKRDRITNLLRGSSGKKWSRQRLEHGYGAPVHGGCQSCAETQGNKDALNVRVLNEPTRRSLRRLEGSWLRPTTDLGAV